VIAATDSYPGDAGDFLLINRFARRTGWLHGFMTGYAGYGLLVFAVLLVAGWWIARSARDTRALAAVAWSGLGTLLALALNQPIVNAVAERRPYASIPHVLVLVGRSSDYGFPSDHATMAGAVAAGLCFASRRLGIAAWFAAVLLAFARVYVGAHYPHDVLAGLLFGAAVVTVTGFAARPLLVRALTSLAATPVRPLLLAAPVREGAAT
jgi:undecaprenyl-diphosphatase